MINEARIKNGLKELDLIFVDMILVDENEHSKKFSNKTSSTYIRQYLEELKKSQSLKE